MTIINQNQFLSLDLGNRFHQHEAVSAQSGVKSAPKVVGNVKIHPVVLFAILDHFLRRPADQVGVIGTLLGAWSDDGTTIEVRNCFPVPHSESDEQVAVDMDHHRKMFELHQKVSKTEIIVGWYTTGDSLNPYSALIQNFYNTETERHGAVHLIMDTTLQGEDFGVKAFTSSPLGIDKSEDCVFRPLPCDIQLHRAEKAGLDVLCSSRSAGDSNTSHNILTDSVNLVRAIRQIQDMLTRVHAYIESVLDEKVPANPVIGRYLMDTLAMVPKIDVETFDKTFHAHVQDLLMVIYLSNITRAQLALAESVHSLV